MSEYFRHSSTTYYSLIASLPLLLGYEILVTLTQSPFWGVRNAADVWIRTFMMAFDIRPQYIFFVMILIVIGMIPVIKVKGSAPPLKGSIFLVMFLEALAYSMVLGIVLHFMVRLVLLSAGGFAGNALQNIALSLGAGLFEEFFFRVLLLNVLFWGLKFILRTTLLTGLVAILTASLLFSLSHYIGNRPTLSSGTVLSSAGWQGFFSPFFIFFAVLPSPPTPTPFMTFRSCFECPAY